MPSDNWFPFQRHLTKSQLHTVFRQSAFTDTARTMAAIEESSFNAVVLRLTEEKGFLGRTRLTEIVAENVAQEDHADAVVSALTNFATFRELVGGAFDFDAVIPPLISDAIEEMLDVAAMAASRLSSLLGPFEAIERSAKAENVAGRIASSLHEVDFVSDLRPVFDEDREEVLGCVPITSVRLVIDGPEVFPRTVLFQVTEAQLATLCEQAAQARKKLSALKATLKKAAIALPDTSWTTGEHQ